MKGKTGCFNAILTMAFFFFIAQADIFGQENNWMGLNIQQIVNATRWKIGSFRANAAFRLDNAGYDSDIYYGFTPTPVPDYRFTAGPELRLFLPLKKKVIFDITEIPQYLFFLRTKDERAWNNIFRGQVHFVMDRLYLQAGGGMANIRERLSTEINVNIRRKENSLIGLTLLQLSQQASIALQFRETMFDYQNPPDGSYDVRQILNRKEIFINLRTYLQQASRTRYYLDGEFGSYVFTEAASNLRDSRSYGIFGGAEFLPPVEGRAQTRGVNGRINLGYKYFNVLNPSTRDFSGIVGNTSVAVGIMRLTAARGFFAKDVQFSTFSDVTYYIQTVYGGGITRFAGRRILLAYDLYFSRNTYPLSADGEPSSETINFRTHSFRVRLTLRRDLELNLLASIGQRTLNQVEHRDKRNFFGFSLIYGYTTNDNPVVANPIVQF